MPVPIEKLYALPTFRHLRDDYMENLARYWNSRDIRPGEILWKEGDIAREMGLVLGGELQVMVGEQEVGRVKDGEFLGELSVFTHRAIRSASLKAVIRTEVLTFSTDDLGMLPTRDPILYDILLDQALAAMVRRIRSTDLRIAKLSSGSMPEPEDLSPRTMGLLKMVRAIRGHRAAPDIELYLRNLPQLRARPPKVYETLKAAFTPQAMARDEILFREGEEGNSAFLLAEGEIAVVRHVRGRRADILVRLQPGELFGTITLVSPGHRTATCMALRPGWVFRMDVKAYEALTGQMKEAWKECLVVNLGVQLRNGNSLLARMTAGDHKGGPLPDSDYEQILRDAGLGKEPAS